MQFINKYYLQALVKGDAYEILSSCKAKTEMLNENYKADIRTQLGTFTDAPFPLILTIQCKDTKNNRKAMGYIEPIVYDAIHELIKQDIHFELASYLTNSPKAKLLKQNEAVDKREEVDRF